MDSMDSESSPRRFSPDAPPPAATQPDRSREAAPAWDATVAVEKSLVEQACRRDREAARAIPDLLDAARRVLKPEGFEVRSILGRGGNGIVFFARDERLDRDVAIKALLPARMLDADERAAFQREARILARFTHENIVRVHAILEREGLVFLIMEYVEGESLSSLVTRRERLSEREALLLAIGILRGVEAAHRAGILHRDLKPENVLLTRDGIPRVVDFGLAGNRPEIAREAGLVVGTPSFMAPEQAAGEIATPRTDLYNVGLILWYMLTGKRPLAGDTTCGILDRAVAEKLRAQGTSGVEASPRTQALLDRALAVDPIERPLDAGVFREACEAALLAGGYRGPAGKRLRAVGRVLLWLAAPVLALLLAWILAAQRERHHEQSLRRQLDPAVQATIRDLKAQVFQAQARSPESALAVLPSLAPTAEELAHFCSTLEKASKSAAAADLLDLLNRAEPLLLAGEILCLAETANPAFSPEALGRIERILREKKTEELRTLRRTLLYAPERLRAEPTSPAAANPRQ